ARAAVDVAAHEVDVLPLDVDGGEDDPSDRRRAEILDRRTESGDDAIGVCLAQRLAPRSVARVELAESIALDAPGGELLELDPDHPLAVGCARRVEGTRLAADDRRLGGEEAALRLVDGARDAVETRGDVHDRGAGELRCAWAFPAGQLVEGDMD